MAKASSAQGLHPSAKIGVLGAGRMGADIAMVAAAAGHSVVLYDVRPGAAEAALAAQGTALRKAAERRRLDPVQIPLRLARLSAAETLDDMAGAALIIEAIVEDLEAKTEAFKALEHIAPSAILASNTSSLSISALGARLARPDLFAGFHFFNPATVLPLVEVVKGAGTAPEVIRTLVETARAWGKLPVECGSTPGFIVNRVARPFYGEALRLLGERALEPSTLDALMRDCGGFRMGPCELMDLIGHDVNFAVTRSVYDAFFSDPRYRPSLVQKELVDAGWLGRKAERGFYVYGEGAPSALPAVAPPAAFPTHVCWGLQLGPAGGLTGLAEASGLITNETRDSDVIALGDVDLRLTDGRSAAQVSDDRGRPTIVFDLALDYATAGRIAIAGPFGVDVEPAVGLLQRLGKAVSIIDDAPGLVVARTVAMLVNEAADALHQQVASSADIDVSMVNGVNYPVGPLEWGDRLGAAWVCKVLDHLAAAYPEGRYRASPLLRRRTLDGYKIMETAA